jgi:hypothetical protein
MTDVVKNKSDLIRSEAEARRLYTAPPKTYTGKVGLEVEMALYRPGKTRPDIPDAQTLTDLHAELKRKGHDAQLEASGVLEYASPPENLDRVGHLVAKVKTDMADFEQASAQRGYARAPMSIMPTTTVEQALDNKISRERLEASLQVIAEVLDPSLIRVPLLTTGVQTSFSPKTMDELFNMTYRGYGLTPLLIAAMNSSPPYVENDPKRLNHHLRGDFYNAYGGSGGLSQAFLKATDTESFIRNHIKAVFDAPMFFAYDHDGSLIRSTKDDVLTFRKLCDRGLNTLSNYELAETFLYNDIKICNLRDETGAVVGKRVEVRAADSGAHQPVSTLLLTAALVPDGKTAEKFDALLKAYGFTGDPATDAPLLQQARHDAVYHEGRFMDIPFGKDAAGKPRSLREFAADVAGLIVEHYAAEKALAPDVSRLADILLTGNCDARVMAAQYRDLGELTAALQQPSAAATLAAKRAPAHKPH